MSRSFRIPIVKAACNTAWSKTFKRKIRRRIRNVIKDIKNLSDLESYEIPSPKTIVNDWDVIDYKIDFRKRYYSKEDREKYSRK